MIQIVFFNEKWISAHIVTGDPIALKFYVDPPENWVQVNKDRVETHFTDFDLAKRYSIQAAEELSTLLDQRKGFMHDFTPQQFKKYLSSYDGDSLFINHWKRVMYCALREDDVFCSKEF